MKPDLLIEPAHGNLWQWPDLIGQGSLFLLFDGKGLGKIKSWINFPGFGHSPPIFRTQFAPDHT